MRKETTKVAVRALRQAILDDLTAGRTYAEIWRHHIRDAGKMITYEKFRVRCHLEGLFDPCKPPAAAPPTAKNAPKEKAGMEVPPRGFNQAQAQAQATVPSPASLPPANATGFKPMNSTLDGLSPNEYLARRVAEARAQKASPR